MTPCFFVLSNFPKPGSALTGNGRVRSHWRKQHSETHDVHELVWARLMELYPRWIGIPRWERAKLHVTFVVPDERRRDNSNYAMAVKPIEDALVLTRVMADDDTKHCQTTSEIVYEKGVREARVHVEEWPDDE